MIPKVDRIGLVYTDVDLVAGTASVWIPDWEFSHPTKSGMNISFHGGPPPAQPNFVVTASSTQTAQVLLCE